MKQFIVLLLLIAGIKVLGQSNEILTNKLILDLVKAGFGKTLIIHKIAVSNCNFTTDTQSLVNLKKSGVDDEVIEAMVEKKPGAGTATSPKSSDGNGSKQLPATEPKAAKIALTPIAKILFKDVKCKLTDAEKNQIADSTGFVLSGNKEDPFAMDKESLEYPYSAQVSITDMNKDGIEEVFIQFGNTYTSGHAGFSIVLFIRNKQGVYRANLGFPGMEPEQLKPGYGGYPDLLIGGPGFEFPVWRWNGKEYVFYKTQKQ